MSFWDGKKIFQEPPSYNTYIKKSNIQGLKNIGLLQELPFYDELNIYAFYILNIKYLSKAFGWDEKSYNVDIVDSKNPLAQLEVSKSSIKDLFNNLLDEIKGFKYQVTVKVLLRKDRPENLGPETET